MPTLYLPDNVLESPASAISLRARWEAELDRRLEAATRRFLTATLREFERQNFDRLGQALVLDLYTNAVDEVVRQYDADEPTLELLRESLLDTDLPDEVYHSTALVVQEIPAANRLEVMELLLDFDTPSAELETATAAAGSADPETITAAGFGGAAGRFIAGVAIGSAAARAAPAAAKVIRERGPGWAAKARSKARSAATQIDGHLTQAQIRSTRGPHGDGYPYKMWVSRQDDSVRETHAAADGQKVPVNSAFDVGGFEMKFPGDGSAPIEERINCRCVMVGARA